MKKRKLLIIPAVIVAVIALFSMVFVAMNFSIVTASISGKKLYRDKDIEQAYDRGYDEGCKGNADLQAQIDEYLATIETLNAQIAELSEQSEEGTLTIAQLQALINQLQGNIQSLIEVIENGQSADKVLATFTVKGNIVGVVAVNKNTTLNAAQIPTVKSTPDYTFKGWTVDGIDVAVTSYELQENTTFVAKLGPPPPRGQ